MSKENQKKQEKKVQPKQIQSLKGMRDILPDEWVWWDRIETVARKLAEAYHFGRIETPIMEYAALYDRTSGEDSDVVQKEMYTFRSKGGDLLALRPEVTPGVGRSYLEHNMSRAGGMQKLWYLSRMFRHENPQAGRYRQFSQLGFEIIGSPSDPLYDAQIIVLFQRFLEELKIKGISLKINSIGCRICRPIYRRHLQAYYKPKLKDMCENCKRRFAENPLRLLDCKNEKCEPHKAHAPNFLDRLCSPCMKQFKEVLEYLDELKISYALDHQLVRGLDYYSRTVFEFYSEVDGQNFGALPGGGRYDYLIESLGGRPTPAVGGATGIERVIDVMRAQGVILSEKPKKKVFLIHVGESAKKKMLLLLEQLRSAGIAVGEALSRESLKGQMKMADREGAALALIFGQKEIFENNIIIRDLRHSLQETVTLDKMVDEVKKRLR